MVRKVALSGSSELVSSLAGVQASIPLAFQNHLMLGQSLNARTCCVGLRRGRVCLCNCRVCVVCVLQPCDTPSYLQVLMPGLAGTETECKVLFYVGCGCREAEG